MKLSVQEFNPTNVEGKALIIFQDKFDFTRVGPEKGKKKLEYYAETGVLSDSAAFKYLCYELEIHPENLKAALLTKRLWDGSRKNKDKKSVDSIKEHSFIWKILNGRIISCKPA